MADTDPPQLISLASRALLDAKDFYAVQRPSAPHLFNVFDADGEFRFSCTATINAENLEFMIAYGQREYQRGVKHGGDGLRSTLRELLQVDQSPRFAA